jgi:L-ascorbate metabolism protein UlaG (beta-lactamase superfamily)
VNRWPANEQLVPPIQFALNAKHKHLELLRSYLDSPVEHHKAAHTEDLIGGPWVDVPPSRANEVQALVDELERGPSSILELADEVTALDKLLDEAKGASMAPLYERIPARLRGYVELVYDHRNNPSMRFIEPLIYRSSLYRRDLQAVGLELLQGDARPFQDTTPLLDTPARFDLRRPFDDDALTALFASRRTPQTFGELCERLGIASAHLDRFRTYFTPEAPRVMERFLGPGVRIRYFGHACVLFETRDTSILTDPLIGYECPTGASRFTHADLPRTIDYVVLTHFHKDHTDVETLLQLRPMVGSIVIPKNLGGALHDPSFKLMLNALGFRHVIEIEALESLEVPGGSITALPFLGEHADLDIRARAAHLIRLAGYSMLCAADSDNIEPEMYRLLHKEMDDFDVLFLGMECVGAPMSVTYRAYMLRSVSRRFDQQRRTTGSNFAKAQKIVEEFRIKRVYVYAMGLEPWLGHILPVIGDGRDALGVQESDRLIKHCVDRGLIAGRPYCRAEIELPSKT